MSLLTPRSRRFPSPPPASENAGESLSAGGNSDTPAPTLAVPVACGRCGAETNRAPDFTARGTVWSLCIACEATRMLAESLGTPLALAVLVDATGVQLSADQRTHVEYASTLVKPGERPRVPADRLTRDGQRPDDAPGPSRWWFLDLAPLRDAAGAFMRAHTPRRGPGGMPCVECGQTHAVGWHETTGGKRCDDCQHDATNLPYSDRGADEIRADVVIAQALGRPYVRLAARSQAGNYDGGQYTPMPRADQRKGYGPAGDRRGRWEFITPAERRALAAAHKQATEYGRPGATRTVQMGVSAYPTDEDGIRMPTVRDRVAQFDKLTEASRKAAKQVSVSPSGRSGRRG